MRIEVAHRPAYAMATVHLSPGETCVAEAGAMVAMDSHVQMDTSAAKPGEGLLGGLFGGLKRMVAGESFFQNRFSAATPGTVSFAPTLPGDVVAHELTGGTLILQSAAYLCCADTVTIDAKWGGARSFFGGEGLIMLKATGSGPIAFGAFGGVREIDVDGAFTVDTGHIVAFEDTLKFKVGKFGGGWAAFLFGGEGLVCNFTGKGKLWIQTRTPQGFGKAVGELLPPRTN